MNRRSFLRLGFGAGLCGMTSRGSDFVIAGRRKNSDPFGSVERRLLYVTLHTSTFGREIRGFSHSEV